MRPRGLVQDILGFQSSFLFTAVNDAPDITYTCPTACTGGAFSGSNPAPGVGVDYSFDGSTDAKPSMPAPRRNEEFSAPAFAQIMYDLALQRT